jgi:hypothetical protein
MSTYFMKEICSARVQEVNVNNFHSSNGRTLKNPITSALERRNKRKSKLFNCAPRNEGAEYGTL